jgi:drug/metabolite transporter (DMT)-like permease
MAGWLSAMLVIAVAGREAARELHVFQIMEMRSVIGLAMLWPLVRAAGGWRAMRTARLAQHIGRNTVHYGAQFAGFYALTLIPLAQVVSIEFTMPIWVAGLAVAFLGERMNVWKVCAIALGLVGVAIIVRPDAGAVQAGQWIALAAAVGFGISVIMVKSLTRTESVVAIIFWMLIVQSAIGLLPALETWRTPSAQVWPWILLIAFVGTFSHYCMARAMLHADATVVVPMDFLRVPLTAAAGWLLYAERIDRWTVLGAALILGAVALLPLWDVNPAVLPKLTQGMAHAGIALWMVVIAAHQWAAPAE